VQPEHLAEERLADPPLHRREQPDNLVQGGRQELRPGRRVSGLRRSG
jgi:hypothetical protein